MSIEGFPSLNKFPTPPHFRNITVDPNEKALDYVLAMAEADPNISNEQVAELREDVEEAEERNDNLDVDMLDDE